MRGYGREYEREGRQRSRPNSEIGEWREDVWVWYGDRSEPLNYVHGLSPGGGYDRVYRGAPPRGRGRAYDAGYQDHAPRRPPRPREYNVEFARARHTDQRPYGGWRYDRFVRGGNRGYD